MMPLDSFLRSAYQQRLNESLLLPLEQRAIAYDPADCEAVESVGPYIKRLDPRRILKQKKGTPDDAQLARPSDTAIVRPSWDPVRFNFSKIRPEERLMELELAQGLYAVVTNKFPACRHHLLLVARELRPQILGLQDLEAIREFLGRSSFLAFFNSWSAAASVNHLHLQLLDEEVPLLHFPLESAENLPNSEAQRIRSYPAVNLVFPAQAVAAAWNVVRMLQEANQPHNLFFTQEWTYLFPRNPDPRQKGLEILGEQTGALEYAGVFTTYERSFYNGLTLERIETLLRTTTAAPIRGSRL